MQATIKLRQVRHSAKKLRPVARLFVGKNLDMAINTSSIMSQDSARFMHQAFLMAKAAAEHKEITSDKAIIKEIMATEGPKIKRMRPNARGRSNAYQKHIAHLVVTVSDEVKEAKAKTVKKAETSKESK